MLNVVIAALRMFNIKFFYSKKQLISDHSNCYYFYSVSLRCRRNIVVIFINCNNCCKNYSILHFLFKKRINSCIAVVNATLFKWFLDSACNHFNFQTHDILYRHRHIEESWYLTICLTQFQKSQKFTYRSHRCLMIERTIKHD